MRTIFCRSFINFYRVIIILCVTEFMFVQLLKRRDDYKFILFWPKNTILNKYFGNGQAYFLRDNCTVNKCIVTNNRRMFGGDLKRFDAVLFDGWNYDWNILPKQRYSHQKYVYVNLESGDRYCVCNRVFDSFFNWTITYKLDSDIVFPYLHVKDVDGNIVGPKRDMKWVTSDFYDKRELTEKLRSKTIAAAWFVSRCRHSRRRDLVKKMHSALHQYNLTLDVYGKCGPLKCPKSESDRCDAKLAADYYFYLAFENSFDEDYVTEKVFRAMVNDVVPIVLGGANYTRFLPPGSFIDSRAYSPVQLASLVHRLMNNLEEYSQLFSWKYHYSFCSGDRTIPTNRSNCTALRSYHTHPTDDVANDLCFLKNALLK